VARKIPCLWDGNAGQAEEGKKKLQAAPDVKDLLTTLIESLKAGSPSDPGVYWISVKPWQIAHRFYEQHHIKVSHGLIKRLLRELGYAYRKQCKQLATGTYARRDEQFQVICYVVLLMSVESPVVSIDCKKKERLGNFYRSGRCYCSGGVKVYDHDYELLGEGKVIPHGIYDLKENKGYLSIGASSETAAFVLDNLLWWWWEYGLHLYPDAKNLLLLCDAGGANSYRHYVFKQKLLVFATETGLSVIVCHYPPYCSKWNPIEHRLFCHVHKAMEGGVFTSYETVRCLMEQTATKTGLTVVVRLNLKHYEKAEKGNKISLDQSRIAYHPTIPELNYRIYP
jgi:hypothetical protein